MTDPSRRRAPDHESIPARGGELLLQAQRTAAVVADAQRAIARGEMVIVTGDRHSGFVGALVAAVEPLTPETVNFFITHARGPLYATMEAKRLEALGLEVIRPAGANGRRPAVHVPVDVRAGTTTGLSASDRAATIRALAHPASHGEHFRVPGHVFPLGAVPGGVLQRPGHTEAAVDLVGMAGLVPAATTCTILTDEGRTAAAEEIRAFAAEHGLLVLQIADIAAYRRQQEDAIDRVGEASLPTPDGRFLALGYSDRYETGEHVAFVLGDLQQPGPIPVRVHTECLAGDVFHFTGCDCALSLSRSIDDIVDHGRGVLLYIRAPGGDRTRLRHLEPAVAPGLEDEDAKAAATAVNGVALSMLRDLGITAERLALDAPASSAA